MAKLSPQERARSFFCGGVTVSNCAAISHFLSRRENGPNPTYSAASTLAAAWACLRSSMCFAFAPAAFAASESWYISWRS